MNKYIIMSIICFISGIALIGLGISRGEGEVYWAVIFPIFHGNGIIFFLGSILLILGIVLMMIGFVAGSGSIQWGSFDDLLSDEDYEDDHPEQYPSRHGRDHRPYKKGYNEPLERRPTKQTATTNRSRRSSVRTGGVVFIGPIPIIWGSDKKIGYIMAVVAVIMVIIFLIFTLAWIL